MLEKRLAEQKKEHLAELQKEWDEVTRLKAQMVMMQTAHAAELEKAKSTASAEIAKCKQLQTDAEAQAADTQKSLDELRAKADTWLNLLNKINSDMGSKYLFP
jgi:predicted  nucleic acid-binding Zn-ribbon protein